MIMFHRKTRGTAANAKRLNEKCFLGRRIPDAYKASGNECKSLKIKSSAIDSSVNAQKKKFRKSRSISKNKFQTLGITNKYFAIIDLEYLCKIL